MTPRPELVSSAVRRLRLTSENAIQLDSFEISALGMFTLINALHCFIWNATQFQVGREADMAKASHNSRLPGCSYAAEILNRLHNDFSAHTIESLVAEVLLLSSDGVFGDENEALNRWMGWWNTREYRDHKARSFALNPTLFWLLAKLFLLLSTCLDSDELARSDFAPIVAKCHGLQDRMQRQAKIVELLSRLRQPRRVEILRPSQASVARFMEPLSD